MRLTPVTLDLGALLDATLDLVAAPAERRQVVLAAPQLEAGARLVIGDETRVKQVLTNLLSNAVKYNVDGGRVEVSARRAGDRVQLAVRDTGIGLTTAQAEGLFQPFNRLGREHSSIEGTGIGLVISRRLAELMNGALALRATDGSGTTLVLELPAAAASDAGQAAGDAPLTSSALYRQRHVLCVEDNDTNVLLIRGVLAQRPQIVLTVASLGLDALAAVRSRRPDLMLLDMHLPDIDGMDLLQHLKTDDATAAIPVLVLSADATRERIECAMTAGAAGYLLKPLDLSEFLSLIDEILEQADTRWA
jgi:CheY-like chemotaxis protein/anti-sigma regulatory factor (Ser/Thr protein kinase)